MRPLVLTLHVLLLIALPWIWMQPLLYAGLNLPYWPHDAISILSGVQALWRQEPLLAALVALFAMVAPWVKCLAMAAWQMGWLSAKAKPVLQFLSKIAMADVFLVAIYLVIAQGIALTKLEVGAGLWWFTGAVMLSLALSLLPLAPAPKEPPHA